MTEISLMPRSAAHNTFAAVVKAPAGVAVGVVESVPMNADTLAALAEEVAKKMFNERGAGDGRTGAAPLVRLREASVSLEQAAEALAGIVNKLPLMLAALLGGQDPIQGEEGAELRAAEGAAAPAVARISLDGAAAASVAAPVTGADPDITDRSANAGAWIVSSSFSNLLALLRQLLLQFERIDRENSARMVEMQRDITIVAGDKGIEKARESLGGAIGAAVMTGAIGGAALRQTFKATSMKTTTADKNALQGNQIDSAAATSRGGFKGSSTVTAEMRGARAVDGKATPVRTGEKRPASDLQADADVPLKRMKEIAQNSSTQDSAKDLHSDHPEVGARAEIPGAHAMMLNMMAPGIGATVTAGVQIEAEMTEAERQLALQVADVFRRIADEQQDQAAKTRDMRDAAAQLFESMLNLMSSTAAHIISKA